MRSSRARAHSSCHAIPELRFEDQQLTSFAGVVLLQALFDRMRLRAKLTRCFPRRDGRATYRSHVVVLCLIVHLFIGFRRLRDRDFYHDDPMIKRTLGLERVPDVSTFSRTLNSVDDPSVDRLKEMASRQVLDRLNHLALRRITLDFDGSVQSTQGHLEGTAVGYNKQKKGRRSYYPLFATVAQTQQILDLHHRPGNVHDSNGAREFIEKCVKQARKACPGGTVEARMDAAFFDQKILLWLDELGVEFTASVPFARLAELKGFVEDRKRWVKVDERWSFFERTWKPKSWDRPLRFVFLRQKVRRQSKAPLQLDFFEPREHGYQYTVLVTNKAAGARTVFRFHHGRGSQEGIFADAKTSAQLDYLPVRSRNGNQTYTLCAMVAHNMAREIQMNAYEPDRRTTEKRAPLWSFESLHRLRHRIIQRAGRLTRPAGKLTLTLNSNESLSQELQHLLQAQIGA